MCLPSNFRSIANVPRLAVALLTVALLAVLALGFDTAVGMPTSADGLALGKARWALSVPQPGLLPQAGLLPQPGLLPHLDFVAQAEAAPQVGFWPQGRFS